MHDHVYPVPSRELAPEIDKAFQEFSNPAFADGALPRMEAMWAAAEMRAP